MHPEQHCCLFHVEEDEVQAVRQVFGLTEDSIRDSVDSIKEWFQKQPHLVHIEISRKFVEMMIIISKGSMERAKEKIDNYFKYRFLTPEFIQNRKQILCNSNKWDLFTVFPLPKLHDNRRIFIVKFGPDLSKFDIVEFFRRLFLLADLRMINDYMAGDIWIIDMKHVGWKQIFTQNPLVVKKAAQIFTNCYNWRLYGIHGINVTYSTSMIQRVIDFFKQFITSVIMDRVIVHGSLQELYDYVPKECLPEDYGGNEMSTHRLAEITENECKKPKIVEYLLECSKMVSNESLRPRDKNSEEYLSGSFRKLELD